MARMLDSNVLLDLIAVDPMWLDWSTAQFCAAAKEGQVPVTSIIYAELFRCVRPCSCLPDRCG